MDIFATQPSRFEHYDINSDMFSTSVQNKSRYLHFSLADKIC